MELPDLYKTIKNSFCDLLSYKIRQGNVLEIITTFTTLNNRFVSVFVKREKNRIIITDGGWVDSNYYENPIYEESDELVKRVIATYTVAYDVKLSVQHSAGTVYYYKTCELEEQIASCVFDLANFIVGAINAYIVPYKDEKEEKERDTFRKEANTFLKAQYGDSVKLQQALDDFPNIKFNAMVSRGSSVYLITYITGSTFYYFDNDLRKTIVNFEITEKSKYREIIKEKISIINNLSTGYHPERSKSILDLLEEKVTREPVKWTDKEVLLQFIRPN